MSNEDILNNTIDQHVRNAKHTPFKAQTTTDESTAANQCLYLHLVRILHVGIDNAKLVFIALKLVSKNQCNPPIVSIDIFYTVRHNKLSTIARTYDKCIYSVRRLLITTITDNEWKRLIHPTEYAIARATRIHWALTDLNKHHQVQQQAKGWSTTIHRAAHMKLD